MATGEDRLLVWSFTFVQCGVCNDPKLKVSSCRAQKRQFLLGIRVGFGGFRRGAVGVVPGLQPCLIPSLVVVHEQAALAPVTAPAHEIAVRIQVRTSWKMS